MATKMLDLTRVIVEKLAKTKKLAKILYATIPKSSQSFKQLPLETIVIASHTTHKIFVRIEFQFNCGC